MSVLTIPWNIARKLGKTGVYTMAPLALLAPQSAVFNAALLPVVGIWGTKTALWTYGKFRGKKDPKEQQNQQDPGFIGKSPLQRTFDHVKGISKVAALAAAAGTASYIGTNSYEQILQGRTPAWAILGNTVYTADTIVTPMLSIASKGGHFISNSQFNPIPLGWRNDAMVQQFVQFPGRIADAKVKCWHNVIQGDARDAFAGTCVGNGLQSTKNMFGRLEIKGGMSVFGQMDNKGARP